MGARIRFFDFEDRTGNASLGSSLDLYAIDLEFTHAASFHGWSTLMSGGLRIAGIEQSLDAVQGADTIDVDRDFEGVGLTFGVEFERTCWWRSVGLFGNFRGSLLFGDEDAGVSLSSGAVVALSSSTVTIPNETIAVWEIQVGIQHERQTRFGNMVSRIGAEAQMWEQPPMALGVLDANLGLVGPVASITLQR